QALPLHGVFFHDEKTGWAVGELGTVLATTDGGKTWKATKRGGQRAALLFAHARAADAPLDAVALLGAGDGYLTAGLAVTAADGATAAPARAADPALFAETFRQAGGAGAEALWQFPVGSHLAGAGRERLLKHWDGLHGDKAAEQLLRQLVLALRVWRPDVVVTDNPDGKLPDESALVAEALPEAFRRAGGPSAFPEQLQELGLAAWKPAKLYACCPGGKGASVTLDLNEASAGLGTCARDFAAGAAAALAGKDVTLPPQRCFRLLE